MVNKVISTIRMFFIRLRARINEAFVIGMESLFSNKLRSFLTLLGVVIGVMTVVGMMSILEGLNDSMAKQIGELGSNVIYITKMPVVRFGPMDPELRKRKDLKVEDAKAIEESCPSVIHACPEMYYYADVRYESNRIGEVEIDGGDSSYLIVNSLAVESGRGITEQDVIASRYVCILAYEPKEALFPVGDPVGEDIRINGIAFRVIGTLEERGEFFGQSMDNYILIPYTTFQKIFGKERGRITLSIQAVSREAIPRAISEVESILRRRRGVPPEKENDFEIVTQDSLMEIYTKITGSAFAVMVGVAAVSLLVGGIGIMNVMLISVTERTREIGLRKAVGARKSDVLTQFLLESATLSFAGGVGGVVLGIGVAFLIASLSTLPATIPVWSVVLGFVFSVGVGLFFGIYPAYKASVLDPIEALRYE